MESGRSPVSLTASQSAAIKARGNVLVMAGAGTGKTKTLVERCLDCMRRDKAAINELLVVTFTEAAAAEMRDRLRSAMEARLEDEPSWAEQLARFDLAHIGTLHSFCLKLVREHFYELGLDPRLFVLDEGEARQLAADTLDRQLDTHYAGEDVFSQAVQELIQVHGGGRDESIRKLVLQLHYYSQAQPDAAGWLAAHREKFAAAAKPVDWQRWLGEAIDAWCGEWLAQLEQLKSANRKAVELVEILKRPAGTARDTATVMLSQILAADESWPSGRKTILRKPLESLFEGAAFLHSLAAIKGGVDPLAEDWFWVRGQMETLLRLAEEFAQKFGERKRADGALDFHDLEQFALKLLWDFSTGHTTTVAGAWRAKLKYIFVDEYQDINAAQDRIIQGLSRPIQEGNRFLVGDMKQSIYRFRLADPKIFREYARDWRGSAGSSIPLAENFRSRKELLDLANSLFRLVMREEVGGVAYNADAELKFAPTPERDGPDTPNDPALRAELLLRFKNSRAEGRHDGGGDLAGLDDARREARLVAGRVKQLVKNGGKIFDDRTKDFRPVEWRDIAILLRSPRGRSEVFAKEFEQAGVPLAVARGGFYESAEVLDLVSLLQLLDNPLQDVPCIAVLRSPLVGLALEELAEIRLAAREGHFWTALNRANEMGFEKRETSAKVSQFLERFSRWRVLAKQASLSRCLEEVLAETLHADWLRAQSRGPQRAANVAAFLQLAHQFDQFQRQGLFRFLKFIEAQEEGGAEPEVSAMAAEDAVRLMSIHQSKGLEFPVVVVADLSKRFNEQDLHGDIIFDDEYGPSPKVKPPHTGRRYPSLPYWLAQRRQKRELRGEELRLLYVAFTRAREKLILTASITEKHWAEKWNEPQLASPRAIAAANCFADWLALWFSNQAGRSGASDARGMKGRLENLSWRIIPDDSLSFDAPLPESTASGLSATGDRPERAPTGPLEDEAALRARLAWDYPFGPGTRRRSKASVTALRREAEELDDEAEALFAERGQVRRLKGGSGGRRLSAAEIGAAHHKFLQHVALEKLEDLAAEAARLARENHISVKEHGALDFKALGTFWSSELGRNIRTRAADVRRELPFTARFSPVELERLAGIKAEPGLENEFVIVQGVADLVVLNPRDIWLVDFKTDELAVRELDNKLALYGPQLRLYAAALEKIFTCKVTVRALHFLAVGKTVEV